MKKLAIATMVALSTLTVHASPTSDTLDEIDAPPKINLEVLLTSFGVVDYYQSNCAGLTPRGQAITHSLLMRSDLYLLTATKLMNTKAFRNGFTAASKFRCNDLREELFDAGAAQMFR